MAQELRLEAREFKDLSRWRWVLTNAAGGFLADHEVRLDPASWQYEAFADLQHYVSWHAAPDRYREDEARIVAGLGSWVGARVFGPPIADALARAARRGPVTVRVIVPPEARRLPFRPLEVAHVHGRPLAGQDITLVMQTGSADGPAPAVGRLRVLGLFSLPEGGQPLNLRRERHDRRWEAGSGPCGRTRRHARPSPRARQARHRFRVLVCGRGHRGAAQAPRPRKFTTAINRTDQP